MGGSSSKPKDTGPTKAERVQSQLAKEQIDHYRDVYHPLEDKYASEARRDYSTRMGGQAGAAAMRGGTEVLQGAALSRGPVESASMGTSVAAARMGGEYAARDMSREGSFSALNVGLGATGATVDSLSSASRSQAQEAIGAAQNSAMVKEARNGVRNALIGGAAAVGGTYAGKKYAEHQAGKAPEAQTPTNGGPAMSAAPNYQSPFAFLHRSGGRSR